MKPATLPKRVIEMATALEIRRAERRSVQRLVMRHLAEQLVACLKRCDELTPEGEIGILVPSVDDVIIEAEMRFHKPKGEDAV
jgi:hypothetical protein